MRTPLPTTSTASTTSANAMNGHQPRDRQQLTALTFRGLELLLPSSSMKPTNVAVQSSTLTSSSSQGGAQVEGEGDNTAAGIVGLPSPARDLLFDLLAYLSPTARATGERRLDLMSGGAGEVAAAIDSDAAGVSTTATAVASATTGEQVPLTAALTALSTAALTPDDSNTTSTTVAGPLSPRAIDQETVDRVLALKRSVLLQGQARDLPRPCAATSTDTNTSVVLGPATADIPGYRFERVLGSGGFGQVRLATHVLTGCHVAVKCLLKHAVDADPTSSARVLREILVHKQLRHPHICRLLQVIDTPHAIHIILEYCPRGELFSHIRTHGPMPEHEARVTFRQMVEAVAFCHGRGVVHRDLKLENVVVGASGEVKLIDFGFTNVYELGVLLRSNCGSPEYAPPEMLAQQQYQGPPVDMWSLGVNLYTLLTGNLPFDDTRIARVVSKIIAGQYRIPETVSADAASLIRGLIRVDPKARLTAQEVLQHPWLSVTAGDATSAAGTAMTPISSTTTTECWNDMVIRDTAQRMSQSVDEVVATLATNEPSPTYATYFLLAEKHRSARDDDALVASALTGTGATRPTIVTSGLGGAAPTTYDVHVSPTSTSPTSIASRALRERFGRCDGDGV